MNGNLDDFVNEATGKNVDGSSLTVEQLFAIRRAGEVGKRLQEDFPEIADRYRNGMTLPEISLEYCIQELYDTTSRDVARNAVRDALRGYDFDEISYPGLIEDDEERRNIGLEHMRENGKANYEMRKGIHGLTPEQRSETSRKSGKTLYETRKGIHGLTPEQLSENGRKGATAIGFVPWVPAEETNEHYTFSEVETALRLAQCPEYRRGSLIKNAKIADELNVIFHNEGPVRTESAVGSQLRKYQTDTREVIS